MFVLSMWFDNIFRWCFFNIDKVIYNFISYLYDILITIARTSVLTQADIAEMASRIYKLLAIFMIFKVTLSLITYVVNPDDFTDKSKGVSKLSLNIIISLALLILTPYLFNYAYQFQTIILEDNSLATLVFGESNDEDFLTTAGDDMAFIAMSPFFTPNTSISELYDCTDLTVRNSDETISFNPECSGLSSDLEDLGDANSMMGLTSDDRFDKTWLENYVSGVEAGSLSLMFRSDMVTATDKKNENYIIDYKYIFSTLVGAVIVLILVTFCMDIGVRSIKLSFLQLIAPIPILSYVDPKSGKDGLFKKWYEMCFKTYLSLFIRLLALYFAVYIISKVADLKMVDVVDGSYVTNRVVSIFIIIGALMFAKQLPKMLEGLGIKLDGGGKFTLNPLKKFEEEAIGGKNITGAAGGMIAGAIGGVVGKKTPWGMVGGLLGGALGGTARGALGGKGFSGGLAAQADVNRRVREARINGAGFWGSRLAGVAHTFGLDDAHLESQARDIHDRSEAYERANLAVEEQTKGLQRQKKEKEADIAPKQKKIDSRKKVQSTGKAVLDFAKDEVRKNKAGDVSKKYNRLQQTEKLLSGDNLGKELSEGISFEYFDNKSGTFKKHEIKAGEKISQTDIDLASGIAEAYLAKGTDIQNFVDDLIANPTKNAEFTSKYKAYAREVKSENENAAAKTTFKDIKGEVDDIYTEVSDIEDDIRKTQDEIASIDDQIKKVQVDAKVIYKGESISIEAFRDQLEKDKKELDEKKRRSKSASDRALAEAIISSKK